MLQKRRNRAERYIVTHCSGRTYAKNPMIKVFTRSLKHVSDANKIVITADMNSSEKDEFAMCGFDIIEGTAKRSAIHDRWIGYRDFLEIIPPTSVVMFSDCRDVIWQIDPFDCLHNILSDDHGIVLCEEGLTHAQSDWNTRDQKKLRIRTGVIDDFLSWKVYNGGVIGGTVDDLKMLTDAFLDSGLLDNDPDYSDQAILNLLVRELDINFYSSGLDDNLNITGETIRMGIIEGLYHWDNGIIKNKHGKPFANFHQWDRTLYRGEILNKWLIEMEN